MISSKRNPNLIETDRGKKFYNGIFQNFLKKNNIKPYSRNSSIGVVFAERLKKSMRNLLKKFVFKRGDANWIDALPTITKQCNNRIHSSTKLNRIQTSLKKNEGFVCDKLLDKRKKLKPKFQVNDLVRTAVLRRTFSKGVTTNWSYKLYKISEIVNDTIPSYEIDQLSERYKEDLPKTLELSLKDKDVMKKLNLN